MEGFSVRGGIDPVGHCFRPRFVGVNVWKDLRSGDLTLSSPVLLALRTPGWGFHTVRGGIDPRDHRFRPRFVGPDIWIYL